MAVCSFAQTAAEPGSEPATVWHDGSEFPIFGKATELTVSPYDRLPESYQSQIRKRLWNLGRNTAGLYIRFHSDSPTIKLQWTSRFGVKMNHMTDTGVRGLDLYYLADNGQWRFARNGRPSKELFTEATVISNMEAKPREWMLYLPLYDGLKDLKESGVYSFPSMSIFTVPFCLFNFASTCLPSFMCIAYGGSKPPPYAVCFLLFLPYRKIIIYIQ